MVRDELESNRPVIYSGIIAKVAMLSFVMAIRKMRLFILTGVGRYQQWLFLLSALDSDGGDDPYVLYGMGIGIRPPKAGDTKIYMLEVFVS